MTVITSTSHVMLWHGMMMVRDDNGICFEENAKFNLPVTRTMASAMEGELSKLESDTFEEFFVGDLETIEKIASGSKVLKELHACLDEWFDLGLRSA